MFSVFRTFFTGEIPSNKVILCRSDEDYTARDVLYREDGIVLYCPQPGDKKSLFEIVLHKPYSEAMYSVYRNSVKEEAENRFIAYKDIIPKVVDIAKELENVNGLQKICDTMAEHPMWSLAHVSAHFGLHDAFNNALVNSFINSTDPETGMSPLQVAIISQNIKTVSTLINAKSSLEHLDHSGNSVFHYAAKTNKDIITLLAQGSTPRSLNSKDKEGYTPLHRACMEDKCECVNALLMAGADVNISATTEGSSGDEQSNPGYVGNLMADHAKEIYQQDMKFGGTPLHWSCSKAVINSLIDKKCNINSVNFEKRTALHVMVMRDRLECAVALLTRNADPNLGDKEGNTPLHLAAKKGSGSLIQCLLVFGANMDLLNNAGESPRHCIPASLEPKVLFYLHAVGAQRCTPEMHGCTEGCKSGGTFNGIPPPQVCGPASRNMLNQMLAVAGMEINEQKYKGKIPKKGRLLCLDGGGIRGLILIQMLLELERIVGKPIKECFDWIAGTSTGGILALGIATNKSMMDCLCLYFRMKDITFVGIRPYPSENLEKVLKDAFGENTVMTDIKEPKVMVTGCLADRRPVDLHLFRNYTSPTEILGDTDRSSFELPPPPEETLLWHVGRATGAAPTYFKEFGMFLDGGLIANNPTLDALTEIQEYNLALRAKDRADEMQPVTVVVSLGTGLIPVKAQSQTMVGKLSAFQGDLLDTAKMVMGISSIVGLLVDQSTQSDGRVVDRARAWCSSIGIPYFRFCPQMSEDLSMDEKNDERLCKILWETKWYMNSHLATLKEVAELLTRG